MLVNCERNYYVNLERIWYIKQKIYIQRLKLKKKNCTEHGKFWTQHSLAVYVWTDAHPKSADTCLPVRVVFFKLVCKSCMSTFLVALLVVGRENNTGAVLRPVIQKWAHCRSVISVQWWNKWCLFPLFVFLWFLVGGLGFGFFSFFLRLVGWAFFLSKFVVLLCSSVFPQQGGDQWGSSSVALPSVSQLFVQNPRSEADKPYCLLHAGEAIEALPVMSLLLCTSKVFAIFVGELFLEVWVKTECTYVCFKFLLRKV